MNSPLADAIEAAGGLDAFLAAARVAPRTLADWRRFGVPDNRALDVEAACRGAVTAEQLLVERASKLRAQAPQSAA